MHQIRGACFRPVLTLAFALLALLSAPAFGQTHYKIVTASERGTYIQIGRDLSRFVAPGANIDLEVLPSVGSAENVERLRHEPGVKFAMVQSDVFQAFLDLAAGGNADAETLIRPLRVILPLYNEEIYFIARSDSPMNAVHEIKDAKINVGPVRSGTAMSTTTIYRLMFGAPIPEANASYLSNEEALVKLIGDKSIDVVAVVAGQPAKLLADMKPEARQLVKLLKFDPNNPASRAALKTYFPATVRAASYPNLLTEDVPGVAVKAFLVTYDYRLANTTEYLARFARSLCQNFPILRAQGHPKWREVALELPDLGQGWSYYPVTERALRTCVASQPKPVPAQTCSQEERVLGLCK
ncbi:MAG TPA: TAXI family TRAP transporter solute-binding subunit [Burkholderiaceae bacterium]|nr:TAXI family TRAP transporter solute-binding subunit [Burkholderiaceae bacterium]